MFKNDECTDDNKAGLLNTKNNNNKKQTEKTHTKNHNQAGARTIIACVHIKDYNL